MSLRCLLPSGKWAERAPARETSTAAACFTVAPGRLQMPSGPGQVILSTWEQIWFLDKTQKMSHPSALPLLGSSSRSHSGAHRDQV